MMEKADVSTRLRQAILLNDLPLVRRLLKNHPEHLLNPDYAQKSDTSLHLAAQYGYVEIAEFLISLERDSAPQVIDYIYSGRASGIGITINTDGQTPLHVAAAHSQSSLVELLCIHFPETINRIDNLGCTPLHHAASAHASHVTLPSHPIASKTATRSTEDVSTIEILLAHGANVNAQDKAGNTCLHNASAWGNLKAIRSLITAGADPQCSNFAGWTPKYYSLTVQAEVYFRNLVTEWQKQQIEKVVRESEGRIKGGGAVRLVTSEDAHEDGELEQSRSRAGSAKSQTTDVSDATSTTSVARIDAWR